MIVDTFFFQVLSLNTVLSACFWYMIVVNHRLNSLVPFSFHLFKICNIFPDHKSNLYLLPIFENTEKYTDENINHS